MEIQCRGARLLLVWTCAQDPTLGSRQSSNPCCPRPVSSSWPMQPPTVNGAEPLEHFDVLIVGAGLSGIGAACHLQASCPAKTYAIVEARDCIGGTWDLFRYPGIRSDSDMYTLGYVFRPWTDAKVDRGRPIDPLLRAPDRAARHGIEQQDPLQPPRRARRVVERRSALDGRVERTDTGETVQLSCNFLFMCSGYYRYDEGYTPRFEGSERFSGRIVHPQHWTEDLDYEGKRVVVIGSGATAVTLVPAMAERAAHVTMLQRSPELHPLATGRRPDRQARCAACLPARLAYSDRALEERAADDGRASSSAGAGPQAMKALIRKGLEAPAPRRLRHRHALQTRLRPVGPAHVPGARRRPVRRRSRGQRVGRDRPDRDLHRDGHQARAQAPSSRPT